MKDSEKVKWLAVGFGISAFLSVLIDNPKLVKELIGYTCFCKNCIKCRRAHENKKGKIPVSRPKN